MTDMTLRLMKENELAYESLVDIRSAQPTKDRLHYFDTVLEGSAQTNAILLQKLYTDIVSKSNIDFGSIPDSKGNLTKYKEYKAMESCIAALNELYKGVASDDLTMMNELHDMIISCRKDFEFGYTFDVEIVKIMYCTCVMSLYEMINICILDYTKRMKKQAKGIEFDFGNVKKKDLIVIKNVGSLLKSYKNGQWKKMMDMFRKDTQALKASVATESAPIVAAVNVAADGVGKGLLNAAAAAVNAAPAWLSWGVSILLIVVAVFFIFRGLVYFFYSSAAKIADYLKAEKEILDFMIEKEKEDGDLSDKLIAKHEKTSSKMESVANFIEVKILNADKMAKKELEKSNKENYNVASFGANPSFGGDISF